MRRDNLKFVGFLALVFSAWLLWTAFAHAQAFPPTVVMPQTTVQGPQWQVQPPATYVQPLPGGSYMSQTPGQGTTWITKMPGNAYIIQPPIKYNSGVAGDGKGS